MLPLLLIGPFDAGGAPVAPTVTAIAPDVGTAAGGTAVTITGSGFTGATNATLGGVSLTSLVVVNDFTITGVSGARAAGAGLDVVVTKGLPGTLAGAWNYLPSGYVQHLRADLGISLNSGNVSAWADQSGSSRDVAQSSAGAQPLYVSSDATFNNKACISFNGSCVLAGGTARAGTTAITLCSVFATSQVGASAIDGKRQAAYCYSHDCESHHLNSNWPSGVATTSDNPVNDGLAHLGLTAWDAAITSGSIDQYVDGTIASTLAASVASLFDNTDKDCVGGESSVPFGDGYQFGGKYAERLVYPRKLSSGEIAVVTTYLRTRYGI